jgi:hypothetical protein
VVQDSKAYQRSSFENHNLVHIKKTKNNKEDTPVHGSQ